MPVIVSLERNKSGNYYVEGAKVKVAYCPSRYFTESIKRRLTHMSTKRQDYISWDEYFMGVAMLSGMRSKDPNTQVGACIVSDKHKILSMGYNGFPTGCSDDDFPWVREGDDNKYFYSTHSELNAILNYRGGSLEGSTIYVTLFPCNECAKAIIQCGIREVVYDSDKYASTPGVIASKKMLRAAGVTLRHYEHTNREVKLSL